MTNDKFLTVDIRRVKRPNLPVRQNFNEEELQSLSASIREEGIIVPLLVRPDKENFEVIDGDRRLEAAWREKLSEVPIMVRAANDRETLALRMLANLDRENPDPVSEALFFAKAIAQNKMTVEEFAKLLHRRPGFVEGRLRIAEMPEYMLDALRSKEVSLGVASKLFEIDNPQVLQRYFSSALRDGMTVMGAEQAVNQYQNVEESFKAAGQEVPSNFVPDPPPVVVVQCARCGGSGPIVAMRVVRVHREGCPVEQSHSEE